MNVIISGSTLRRLIPAGAVAAVLAFSYVAQTPTLASNNEVGYGNNCGVKGTGYHDHGKVCPNRPFPGQGEGLTKFGINTVAPPATGANTTVTVNPKTIKSGVTSTSAGDAGPFGKSHGHGNGRGHGSRHG